MDLPLEGVNVMELLVDGTSLDAMKLSVQGGA